MRQGLEDILDEALKRSSQGLPKEEILSAWPEQATELQEMLDIAGALSALPKNIPPKPAMQRKYLLASARQGWLAWLHVSRFAAISASVVLLMSALAGTGYAASRSVPGETLFTLKKTAEKVRLSMTSDPETRATLQMEITKKRLSEAQQVFKNPDRDPKQEVAALTELNAQTKNTIEAVNTAVKTATVKQNSGEIVASLDDIAKKQQNLLSEIKPTETAQGDTAKIIQTTKENATKVAEIKRYLEVASNEQTLATLNSPETVTASGTVVILSTDKIMVGKVAFSVTDKTEIKDATGAAVKFSDIGPYSKADVVGIKKNDELIAEQINLISKTPTETKNSSSTPSSIASSTWPSSKETTQDEPTQTIDPNTAIGSFILEDPAPQSGF